MIQITQLFTFFWFSIFCFGLVFLIADSHILGCNIYEYETSSKQKSSCIGIIHLRHFLFKFYFFRELLRCYFCTGVWCGILTHILFRDFYGNTYWLWHESTLLKWVEGILLASVTGAFISYFLDVIFKCLERYSSSWED